VCVLGVVVPLLRFSASGWAFIRIIPLTFLSSAVVSEVLFFGMVEATFILNSDEG
jgi:hypothetical protein